MMSLGIKNCVETLISFWLSRWVYYILEPILALLDMCVIRAPLVAHFNDFFIGGGLEEHVFASSRSIKKQGCNGIVNLTVSQGEKCPDDVKNT